MRARTRHPRLLHTAIALAVLCVSTLLAAAESARHTVVVVTGDAQPYQQAADAAIARLREAGFTAESVQLSDLTPDRLEAMRRAGSSFLAVGSPAAISLNEQLDDPTPLFYCLVTDAQGKGLTRRQGVHGVSIDVPLAEQVELIARAAPRTRLLAMLYDPDDARSAAQYQEAQAALPRGWRLVAEDVSEHRNIADAIDHMLEQGADMIWMIHDPTVYDAATVRTVLLKALRRRVPVFGFSPQVVRAGALVGVGVDPASQGTQAADLIQRTAAGDHVTAVAAPRVQVAINLTIADKLDLELPAPLVGQASHVFGREAR